MIADEAYRRKLEDPRYRMVVSSACSVSVDVSIRVPLCDADDEKWVHSYSAFVDRVCESVGCAGIYIAHCLLDDGVFSVDFWTPYRGTDSFFRIRFVFDVVDGEFGYGIMGDYRDGDCLFDMIICDIGSCCSAFLSCDDGFFDA